MIGVLDNLSKFTRENTKLLNLYERNRSMAWTVFTLTRLLYQASDDHDGLVGEIIDIELQKRLLEVTTRLID